VAAFIEFDGRVRHYELIEEVAQFAATVSADLARWASVVKASGFVADD